MACPPFPCSAAQRLCPLILAAGRVRTVWTYEHLVPLGREQHPVVAANARHAAAVACRPQHTCTIGGGHAPTSVPPTLQAPHDILVPCEGALEFIMHLPPTAIPFHDVDSTQPAHHQWPALGVDSLAARWPWFSLRLKVHRIHSTRGGLRPRAALHKVCRCFGAQ